MVFLGHRLHLETPQFMDLYAGDWSENQLGFLRLDRVEVVLRGSEG